MDTKTESLPVETLQLLFKIQLQVFYYIRYQCKHLKGAHSHPEKESVKYILSLIYSHVLF